MHVTIIDTSSLGDRSYLVTDRGVAAVIDPQRDIDRVLDLAREQNVSITHVLETHIHNDYVTGGFELARTVGAEYVVAAADQVGYECLRVAEGDVIDVGPFRFQVIHTPGHTHTHLSYVLQDNSGSPVGVFTGGSMLHGTTGRTDLLGAQYTDELTHAQFHSVRRLAAELPDDVSVYPTHGFGSFCAATPSSGDSSTIAEQRNNNPALTNDEQTYVEELIAGLAAYPAYYAHMGVINAAGPAPVDLSMPEPVDPAELRRRIEGGEWVVDVRNRTAFATGHLAGTFGFELSTQFATYLGWLYAWGAPLTLIGCDPDQLLQARRELARIGIDNLSGVAGTDVAALALNSSLQAYRVAKFSELSEALDAADLTVLDVRQTNEYRNSHIRHALNIPLHELLARLDEVPDGQVWVHCGSGYRASIAASIVEKPGRTVILVDDAFDNATPDDLTTEG
ncbi:MBL fold metallo-hydrolase [soil metagenome]